MAGALRWLSLPNVGIIMTNHNQKPVEPRLEVGPETDDGSSVCEVLLDEGSAETLVELQNVFDVFSRGTECGMFRSDSRSSLRPKFRLAEHYVSSDRNRANWRFDGSHVGHTAYRVLINLLRQMPGGLPNGLSVRINAASGDGSDKAEWSALSVFTQPRASHLPFNLEDDVLDPPRKQTVVMIYTVDDLREEVTVQVSDALDAWADVVMAGGLSNELSDGSKEGEVASLIEHYQIGPRSIECSIFRLEFPSGVVDALVNVLVFLHETVVKIESVEMD
jgi:hypothetical protein